MGLARAAPSFPLLPDAPVALGLLDMLERILPADDVEARLPLALISEIDEVTDADTMDDMPIIEVSVAVLFDSEPEASSAGGEYVCRYCCTLVGNAVNQLGLLPAANAD